MTGIRAGVVALVAVALVFLALTRDARRLAFVSNSVMLLPADTAATFLRDSSFVLQLPDNGSPSYPISISAFHDARRGALSEREIVRAIESTAATYPGARLTRVTGGAGITMLAGLTGFAWTTVVLDVGPLGSFRKDVSLHCVVPIKGGGATVMQMPLAVSHGELPDTSMLTLHLTEVIARARQARCPGTEGDAMIAERNALPNAAPSTTIARLVMSRDTLHLSVGEVVNPAEALNITAVGDHEVIVPSFTPSYSVEDGTRVAVDGARLRGVAVGITRATVRGRPPTQAREATEQKGAGSVASFVIVVTP